jgi:glutamyl-tRNA synthetase
MRLPADEVLRRIRPDLEAAGWWSDDLATTRIAWTRRVIDLLKPRAKKLSDIAPQMRPFLSDALVVDEAAVAKHLGDPVVRPLLKQVAAALRALEPYDAATLEATLRTVATDHGVKAGVLIHGTRVLVTGQGNSPGLFDVLELVGRDRVIRRLDS